MDVTPATPCNSNSNLSNSAFTGAQLLECKEKGKRWALKLLLNSSRSPNWMRDIGSQAEAARSHWTREHSRSLVATSTASAQDMQWVALPGAHTELFPIFQATALLVAHESTQPKLLTRVKFPKQHCWPSQGSLRSHLARDMEPTCQGVASCSQGWDNWTLFSI